MHCEYENALLKNWKDWRAWKMRIHEKLFSPFYFYYHPLATKLWICIFLIRLSYCRYICTKCENWFWYWNYLCKCLRNLTVYLANHPGLKLPGCRPNLRLVPPCLGQTEKEIGSCHSTYTLAIQDIYIQALARYVKHEYYCIGSRNKTE